jgi:N-acetylglutamate synthase-like GNAT family acetyltransferase
MLKIRPAGKTDYDAIKKLLRELDLFYAALMMEGFWVAEKEGKIIGAAQLQDHGDFFFLGSLGVLAKERKKGVAATLLEKALGKADKDIYLYTIIPDFFRKFKFKIVSPLPGLPSKDRYECEDCHLDKCVCMVRKAP